MKRVRVCSATFRCPLSDYSTIIWVSKMIQRQVMKRPHIRYPIPNIEPPIIQPINEYMHIACIIVTIMPPKKRKDLL